MLGVDSEEAGRRSRGGWFRDPGRDDGSWAGWQQPGGRKSDSGCILEVELRGFAQGLDAGVREKRGVRHNRKVYGPCSWKDEVVRS